jgi:Na+/melibiose symporter-like transporter
MSAQEVSQAPVKLSFGYKVTWGVASFGRSLISGIYGALLTKPAQSVAIALSPFILEITNFITREANQGQITLNQPAEAIFGIKILVGLIPGAAMLVGAALLYFYPLRGDYLAEVKEKVLTLHAEKKMKLK